MIKRVVCFYCGNEYAAPFLHQTHTHEENGGADFFADLNTGIACPRCSTQNDVTENLPDWK